MSRLSFTVLGGALLAGLLVPATPAAAQTPSHVRVVHGPVIIQGWFRTLPRDVLYIAQQGTVLEVLDRDEDWYWVVVPPNDWGTRKAGWIRVSSVERVDPADLRAAQASEDMPGAFPGTSGAPADESVTISQRQEMTPPAAAYAPPARSYTFDEVLFERDRHALRPEEMDSLRAVAAALKADPSLEINIEGHTCSLGSEAYNLGLGLRRANAVKDFLVSEGIAAERLHAVSLGEKHATHDNAREETRRLNRRVAIVPDTAAEVVSR